jgi:hypothetical protein
MNPSREAKRNEAAALLSRLPVLDRDYFKTAPPGGYKAVFRDDWSGRQQWWVVRIQCGRGPRTVTRYPTGVRA